MPLLKDQPDLSVKMVLDTKSRQKQRAWTRLCGRQVADVPMPMLKIYVCVYKVYNSFLCILKYCNKFSCIPKYCDESLCILREAVKNVLADFVR